LTNEILNTYFSPANIKLAYHRVICWSDRLVKDRFGIHAFEANLDENCLTLSDKIISGQYKPQRGFKFYEPKSSGTQRTKTLLMIEDALIYQAIANIIAQRSYKKLNANENFVFGSVLTKEVLKGTGLLNNENPNYFFFKSWKSLFGKFKESVIRAIEVDKATYKFETDITGFFDAIPHYNLLITLSRDFAVEDEILDILSECFNVWSGTKENSTPGVGIPQGVQPSFFFANLLLYQLDNTIVNNAFMYYRYMDDINIYGYSEEDLLDVLVKVDNYLKGHGLSINTKKTNIQKIDATKEDATVKELRKLSFISIDYDEGDILDDAYDSMVFDDDLGHIDDVLFDVDDDIGYIDDVLGDDYLDDSNDMLSEDDTVDSDNFSDDENESDTVEGNNLDSHKDTSTETDQDNRENIQPLSERKIDKVISKNISSFLGQSGEPDESNKITKHTLTAPSEITEFWFSEKKSVEKDLHNLFNEEPFELKEENDVDDVDFIIMSARYGTAVKELQNLNVIDDTSADKQLLKYWLFALKKYFWRVKNLVLTLQHYKDDPELKSGLLKLYIFGKNYEVYRYFIVSALNYNASFEGKELRDMFGWIKKEESDLVKYALYCLLIRHVQNEQLKSSIKSQLAFEKTNYLKLMVLDYMKKDKKREESMEELINSIGL